MNTTNFLIVYLAIAAFMTAHIYYHGVLLRPRVNVFTLSDRAMLALSSAGIGLLWVLFMAGLVVSGVRQISRHLPRQRVARYSSK